MPRFPVGPVLRHAEELYQSSVGHESAARLAEAAVVVADYELLQHDFPQLASARLIREHPELAGLDDRLRTAAIHERIDAWLLANAAVISSKQTEPNEVNTAIPITDARVDVVRPPLYGRALVVPADGGGLLDVKGSGVRPDATPGLRIHHSGLMFLGEALADLAHQRIIDRVFRYAETSLWTLPTYAVLWLGFWAKTGDGDELPAGAQIRRAHRRPLHGGDLPGGGTERQRIQFEIEMILRHFGLTSCNAATTFERSVDDDGQLSLTYAGASAGSYGPEQQAQIAELMGDRYDRFEGVNIQLIREFAMAPSASQVVDFGHYEVRDRFELPVVSLVGNRLLRWGGALTPEHEDFVQPDPDLCLPLDAWAVGTPATPPPGIPGAARQSPVDYALFELAAGFAAGEVPRARIEADLDARIERACAAWWEESMWTT